MLDNRRRTSDAAHRRAQRRVTVLMLLSSKPLRLVVPVFVLLGIFMIAERELIPQHWPGACYAAQIDNGGRRARPVCVKHIPFADLRTTG